MANPEHLEILKQGVRIWNRWREEHPEIRPDLQGGDFHALNLSRINLYMANLYQTNLYQSKLTGAFLYRTDLRKADISQSDLNEADLRGAALIETNLNKTNLHRAKLGNADLRRANLREANLDLAHLGDTIFGDTDLTAAKGLDSCRHFEPSIIDHCTLAKSEKLPLSFLRGCGLPDALISYLPSILNEPLQLYSVFISYSHQDEAFAKRLHDALQGKGVRCWYAPEDIRGGKKLRDQIDEAIRIHDKLLLILSDHSMKSEWVKTEIANARRREVTEKKQLLFPISLVDFEAIRNWTCFDADTGKDSAREIREYYIPDFSNWKDHDAFEKAFTGLLRDLKADETAIRT